MGHTCSPALCLWGQKAPSTPSPPPQLAPEASQSLGRNVAGQVL